LYLFRAAVQEVVVLVHKSCSGVGDLSSIVEQAELVPVNGFTSLVIQHLMGDEVLVLANGLDQFYQKGLVTNITRTKTLLIL